MDNIDPLSTFDPVAPHSSTFSGMNFLSKQEHQPLSEGQVIKDLNSDQKLEVEGELGWWVGIGSEIESKDVSSIQQRLVHIYGFSLVINSSEQGIKKSPEGAILSKIYLVNKENVEGSQIGEYLGFPLIANLLEEPKDNEHDELAWQALKNNFPYQESHLSYYWFLQIKYLPFLPHRTEPTPGLEEIIQRVLLSQEKENSVNEKEDVRQIEDELENTGNQSEQPLQTKEDTSSNTETEEKSKGETGNEDIEEKKVEIEPEAKGEDNETTKTEDLTNEEEKKEDTDPKNPEEESKEDAGENLESQAEEAST